MQNEVTFCIMAGVFALLTIFHYARADRAEAKLREVGDENAVMLGENDELLLQLHESRGLLVETQGFNRDLITEVQEMAELSRRQALMICDLEEERHQAKPAACGCQMPVFRRVVNASVGLNSQN